MIKSTKNVINHKESLVLKKALDSIHVDIYGESRNSDINIEIDTYVIPTTGKGYCIYNNSTLVLSPNDIINQEFSIEQESIKFSPGYTLGPSRTSAHYELHANLTPEFSTIINPIMDSTTSSFPLRPCKFDLSILSYNEGAITKTINLTNCLLTQYALNLDGTINLTLMPDYWIIS
jgi:hypothetical protein